MINKWVLTLLGVSLAGLAHAADATVVSNPPAAPIVGVAEQPCYGAECAAKVCVPTTTIKKKEKVIYDQKCVDYCIPRCSLFSILSGSCGCDANGKGCLNCGQPRTKHLLVKIIVRDECPETKCEVQPVPCEAPSASIAR